MIGAHAPCCLGVVPLPSWVAVVTMGGNASSERRVSFGVDDEDRVRVLRGVRLSDSIVSRMRESSKDQKPSPSSGSVRSSGTHPPRSIPDPRPEAEGIRDPPAGGDRHKLSDTDDDLYRRYEVEQAIIQEELARLAKRERETAQKRISSSIQQEKLHGHQERRRAEQLAKELERKDAELKHLDGFYKEQLTSIEKKNLEIYRMTAEQFHTAATNAEYRVKQRSYDPVCMDIQSNILKCYRENQQELLSCSNLAQEYRRCVLEAQKNLLFNHG